MQVVDAFQKLTDPKISEAETIPGLSKKSLKFLTSKCFKISLENILLDRFKAGPEISHCDKTNNCKENVRWQQPVLNKSQHALLFVKFKRTNLGKGAAFFE